MAKQIGITEVKAGFYRLAAAVAAGEEIAITKRGKVKAKLVPLEPVVPEKPKRRTGSR
jgi:prevent-host-death family protein